MSDPGQFAAQILETSAPGFAGLVAGLLLERHPEIAGRYGTDAFAGWKSQAQRWILDLSAAVDSGEPKLFHSRARWAREAFDARKVPVEDLRAALVALRDVLQERLPAAAVGTTIPVVDGARIVSVDVKASNGVIHVIDAVIMPPELRAALEVPTAPVVALSLR